MPEDEDAILRRKKFDSEGLLELRSEVGYQAVKDGDGGIKSGYDEAVGSLPEIFVEDGGDGDSKSMRLVEDSERRVNWILLSLMVIAYSVLSLLVGIEFEAEIAIPTLLVLSIVGLILGERWIKNGDLHLLGIAWVIISMKVLYGASLELGNWHLGGLLPLNAEGVGIVLCGLVLFNVILSYRYDSDAVAAQATLVLLAVGSTAGSVAGEDGVIIMLLISIFLLHAIAIHKSSGNLASLGIASSNIWFGMHVVTGGFELGSLNVVALQNPLKLFIAIAMVNIANAYVATKFATSKNWFSDGLETLGIGKPGLWGVSVILSMLGALLVIGSVREEISFAFSIIVLLAVCYFSSYLVVRKSPRTEVFAIAGTAITLLLFGVILIETEIIQVTLDPYWIFSAGGAMSLGLLLIRHQGIVSDTVLWTGSIGATCLILVMTPLEGSNSDRALLLIFALSFLHLLGGYFSIKRRSASLAGVAVLTPWLWPLVLIISNEVLMTLSARGGSIGITRFDSIGLDLEGFMIYLVLNSIFGAWMCSSFGQASLNISSGLVGSSEMSSALKQAEAFNLWNLALWIPLLATIVLTLDGQLSGVDGAFVFGSVSLVHSSSSVIGIRKTSTTSVPILIGVGGVLLQWVGGDSSIIVILIGASVFLPVSIGSWNPKEDWISVAIQTGPVLMLLPRAGGGLSTSVPWLPDPAQCVIAIATISVIVGAIRTKLQQNILPLSTASISHSTIVCMLSIVDGRSEIFWISILLFAFNSIWFVTRGEILRELRSSAEKSKRRQEVNDLEARGVQQGVHMPAVERHKASSDSTSIGEAYVEEVRHYPVLAIVVIIITSAALSLYSLIRGPEPLLVMAIGVFLATIITLEADRSRRIEVRIASTLGSEITHSFAVVGVCCAVVLGHMSPSSSVTDLTDFGMAIAVVLVLGAARLASGERGFDSRRSLVNWVVFPLLATRLAGFVVIGSLPAPLSVDPFDGSLVTWTFPFVLLEVVLLLSIVMDVVLDRKASRTGASEVGFACAVVLLSWGPAGIIAVIRGIVSSVRGGRGSEAGVIALFLPISLISLESVLPVAGPLSETAILVELALFTLILFMGVLIDLDGWSVSSVQNAHILVGVSSFYILSVEVGVIVLICISTLAWSQGITRLRRGLRITGLIDFSLAAVIGIMIWLSTMSSSWLLALTTFLSAELAVVLWLSQRSMKQIEID